MNLCLINSASGWGGGERMFLELALGFREAGHATTVVARPGSVLAGRLPAHIDAYLLSCRSDFDLLSLAKLFRLFRRRRVAAVFCNQGRDCVLAGLAALPLGIPVVRVKAMEETRRNPRNWLIYRGLLSAVVCVSQAVQLGLAELRLPSSRSIVIPNGIEIAVPDIDRLTARQRFGVAAHQFAVAFTGRFVREKGVDLLPAIAAELVAKGVPLRLLMAGDGPLRPAVEAEVQRLGLDGVASFLGFLDDPLPLLVAADAALMPSRTEAFPVAALEALALGAPLVACCAGGVVEIVEDGETALLVPPEDTAGLAAALLRLNREPDLALRLRSRGRIRASEFSRPRMIQSYEALVQRLRGAKPGDFGARSDRG
jgi:glycosyltransferase involved in cell wall biosynthesis